MANLSCYRLLPWLAVLLALTASGAGHGQGAVPNGCAVAGTSILLSACGGDLSAADNTRAMRDALAALAARGGGTLRIDRPGTYNFLPAAAVTGYFSLAAKVSILCEPGVVLKIANANEVNAWFVIRNTAGHSTITDCHLVGNSVSLHSSGTGALLIVLDGAATADMTQVGCVRCFLENFRQPYWAEVLNKSKTHTISHVSFDGLRCKSRSGNLFDVNVLSACIATLGQAASAAGTISGISIRNANGEDGTHLTSFYAGFNTNDVIIDHGMFKNFGQSQRTATFATHTLLSYETETGHDTRPQNFTVSNSTVTNSAEHHLYCYRADGCRFENNQLDTLPDIAGLGAIAPAAIYFNESAGDATGNTVVNGNNPDIIVATIDGKTVSIVNNTGSSSVAPAKGNNTAVMIGAGPVAAGDGTGVVNLVNNSFSRTGGTTGLALSLTTDRIHGIGTVNVTGGRWIGSGYAVFGSDTSGTGSVVAAGIAFSGSPFIQGRNAGVAFIALTKPLRMDGVLIDGGIAAPNGPPLQLKGATNLDLNNVTIQNLGADAGAPVDLRNACGRVRGLQFHNVAVDSTGAMGAAGASLPPCPGH